MNKLEKLEEQYKKLGEEIQALKKEDEFVPGWYMYWDNYKVPIHYIVKFDDVEDLTEAQEDWEHVEPVTQELLNRFLPKPKTKYDWSKFPDWATVAVMNPDGSICCADYESVKVATSDWAGFGASVHGWIHSDEYISYINESQWEDSLEKRPE